MRAIGIVGILAAAWMAPAVALAQEWKSYSYDDAGFAVQFPAPPSVEKSQFRTAAGGALPMTRYSARQDGIVFRIDVVDYSGAETLGANAIADAEKALGATGKVTVAIDARINRDFGRELSIDGADGSRSAVALFYIDKHLIELIGQALPPNAMSKSGDAVRFQQSLQFTGGGAGFGGFGRFPGGGGGRFRGGGPGPQAAAACVGKAAGAAVQLDTPEGKVPATCILIARPDRRPGGGPGDGPPEGPPPPE
jgi:hypothetical protein